MTAGGLPTTLVPAQPARDHIAWLQANGIGVRQLARITGISLGSLSKLLYGHPKQGIPPSRRIRASAFEAILAVQPLLVDGIAPPPPRPDLAALTQAYDRSRMPRISAADREKLLEELLGVLAEQRHDDGWRGQAACIGVPLAMFFPVRGDDATVLDAKRVCRACPVRSECLEANLHELEGIFGGTTERERRLLRDELTTRAAQPAEPDPAPVDPAVADPALV